MDIDIYVNFYSRLAIPLEQIRTTKIEGFDVVNIEVGKGRNINKSDVVKIEDLLILKHGAEISRKESEKGEKDRLDILSLLFYCDVDFRDYYSVLKRIGKEEFCGRLIKIVKEFKEYKYFNIPPRELKLKKKEIIEKLTKI